MTSIAIPGLALRLARRMGLASRTIVTSVAVCLVLAQAAHTDAKAGANDDYKLGVLDKVRLRVFEWRASRDEIYEWVALNAEYNIGTTGKLTLPLIGEVTAAGSTPAQLSRVIGERLKARIGLLEVPDVSLEVVQFRPIYVTGHVEKPGEYPYRPGMTVLQALTLGGGQARHGDGMPRLEREIIAAKGDLDLLADEATLLVARKARLQTELKSLDDIEFPAALTARQNEPIIATLMEQERLVFAARREGLGTQLAALNQLKGYLEKEISALTAQLASHNIQVRSLKEEFGTVSSLVEKGLATAPRRLAMERSVAQFESDHIRLETALLKARQELSRTDLLILELHNKRNGEVTAELQQTQNKLENIKQKTDIAEKLLYESEVIAPRYYADRSRLGPSVPRFTVFRLEARGQVVEMQATEAMMLEPGDTIKVEMLSGVGLSRPQLPADEQLKSPSQSSSAGPRRVSQPVLMHLPK